MPNTLLHLSSLITFTNINVLDTSRKTMPKTAEDCISSLFSKY